MALLHHTLVLPDGQAAMEHVTDACDDSVVVDVLSVLLKGGGKRQWSLDVCTVLLPLIDGLFLSKYDS